MAEDAMLTYRIIRAGEKKVFKIDVGNIDEDDIEDYIYKVATKFKRLHRFRQTMVKLIIASIFLATMKIISYQ